MCQVMVLINGVMIRVINMCRVGKALLHGKAIILIVGSMSVCPFHRRIIWVEGSSPRSSERVVGSFSDGGILVKVSISNISWAETEVSAHESIY